MKCSNRVGGEQHFANPQCDGSKPATAFINIAKPPLREGASLSEMMDYMAPIQVGACTACARAWHHGGSLPEFKGRVSFTGGLK